MSLHGDHLVQHISKAQLRSQNTLHVVGVCSNPVRYQSRYRLAREWIGHMARTDCVDLTVVEATFGDRQNELEEASQHAGANYYPVRVGSESWIKEPLINLGIRHAIARDRYAKYFAWIDMDVFFRDGNWAQETLHQLQHFHVVQPWQDCADLRPSGGIYQHFKSFGYQHQRRVPKQMWPAQPYEYAHSGFAWACTRLFFENVRGLMDFAPLGSADHHMAFACIGEVDDTIHGKMSPSFFRLCREWQAAAMRVTKGEVGFVNGRIEHYFHGPKARRYYRERWQILVDHGFDPDTDLAYDEQGIRVIAQSKPALEQAIGLYNRSRVEDSIEEN
jgi:hypothetical protein